MKAGSVTHYFDKLGVGIVKLDHPLKVGDMVQFQSDQSAFDQAVDEMQLDHHWIDEPYDGEEVGIKVSGEVKPGDDVYLLAQTRKL
jgi:hypothetical protein